MNYKKLKFPTAITTLPDNVKFKFNDGTTIAHYKGGKVYVNGVEYGSDVATLGSPSRLTSNPQYVCYPLFFDLAAIKSYGRKFHRHRIYRAQSRRDKRNRSYNERPHGSSTCFMCNGQMTWCSCCRVYSSNCCVDWGTCQCS